MEPNLLKMKATIIKLIIGAHYSEKATSCNNYNLSITVTLRSD